MTSYDDQVAYYRDVIRRSSDRDETIDFYLEEAAPYKDDEAVRVERDDPLAAALFREEARAIRRACLEARSLGPSRKG